MDVLAQVRPPLQFYRFHVIPSLHPHKYYLLPDAPYHLLPDGGAAHVILLLPLPPPPPLLPLLLLLLLLPLLMFRPSSEYLHIAVNSLCPDGVVPSNISGIVFNSRI